MEDEIAMLQSMGFARNKAKEALNSCDNNLERALDYLLAGGGGDGDKPPSGTSSTSASHSAATASSASGRAAAASAPSSSRATAGRSSSGPGNGVVHSHVASRTSNEAARASSSSHYHGRYSSNSSSSGGRASASASASLSSSPEEESNDIIQSMTSQYTVPGGRSACTCMALMGASILLKEAAAASGLGPDKITSDTLHNMVLRGLETYMYLSAASPVEHLSGEEVLGRGAYADLQMLNGGVRQGVLTHEDTTSRNGGPLGFKAMLTSCQVDAASQQCWLGVLVTKTPESVLVMLPPLRDGSDSSSSCGSSRKYYILVDSHPRQQLSVDGSYAIFHSSMSSLVKSLLKIFPPTNLGPDIPEATTMMYNSFDLYPLQRKKSTSPGR